MRGYLFVYICIFLLVLAVAISAIHCNDRERESIYFKEKTGHINLIKVEEVRTSIEQYIQRYGHRGYFPSFAIGIVTGDTLAYRYCYNTDIHTVYYIASITKIFTALSVMQLVEEGDIDIDAPINVYLPGVIIARDELGSSKVTVRHLISHSSGLPDIRYYYPPERSRADNIETRIPGQIYPAGVHYRYANHGFILLGHLIENISGRSYRTYLHEKIFGPIGMDDAKTHKKLNGAGGISVSMSDMSRFASMWLREGYALSGERIVKAGTIKSMVQQQLYIPSAEIKRYVGLGWRVRSDGNGVLTFFHIGGANGVSAWIQIFPRYNCAVIYLGNPRRYSPELMYFLSRMQDKLADLATVMVGSEDNINEFNPSLPTADLMKSYEGKYRNPLNNSITTIYMRNETLYLSNNKENIRLKPFTSHIFQGGGEMIFYDFVHSSGKDKPDGLATFYGYFKRMQ